MFGNIHAIIRRQKLRKEKTDSRSNTLETRKNNLIANKDEKLDKRHSEKATQETIKKIKAKNIKEKQKDLIVSFFIGLLSIILVYLLYRFFTH